MQRERQDDIDDDATFLGDDWRVGCHDLDVIGHDVNVVGAVGGHTGLQRDR